MELMALNEIKASASRVNAARTEKYKSLENKPKLED